MCGNDGNSSVLFILVSFPFLGFLGFVLGVMMFLLDF